MILFSGRSVYRRQKSNTMIRLIVLLTIVSSVESRAVNITAKGWLIIDLFYIKFGF